MYTRFFDIFMSNLISSAVSITDSRSHPSLTASESIGFVLWLATFD